MQSHSKAILSFTLALVFLIVMANAAVVGTSEYAILPAERFELPARDDGENDKHHGRNTKKATRNYYREQLYHRKMLYR